MKFETNVLIDSLQADIRSLLFRAEQLGNLSPEILQQNPAPGKWSVAQVLEHLNIYSRYYLPAIEDRLHFDRSLPGKVFRSGWLGNYFTNLMKPGPDHTINKRMKAPANAQPGIHSDSKAMLMEFVAQQHQLLTILEISRTVNIEKIRIPTSLSRIITLRLGDTFRFFVAHEQRHFVQISNNLSGFGYLLNEAA